MINSALFKVINKAFKQMRNRNTIGDQWKPNNNQRNLVNSV